MRARLGDLSARLGGELLGDPMREVTRIASFATANADADTSANSSADNSADNSADSSANSSAITFVTQARYAKEMADSRAGCVIASPALREAADALVANGGAAILCDNPLLAFAQLTRWWVAQERPPAAPGVHATAVVEDGARIDPSASIGAFAHIGRGACIGAGVVIGPHCVVGEDAVVGADTWFKPRVTFGERCRIGERCIVFSGAVIGSDGFGFAPTQAVQGRWEKIEQLGTVVIGNDVEIGANSCVDRGALDDTVIEDGVKIDNLVQIAHNVHIGAHTAIAGNTGIAGSARIGRHCMLGGAVNIQGHLEIADGTTVTGTTFISRSIRKPGVYSGGFPFDDNASWEKNAATIRQLHAMRDRLRALEKKA